MSSSNRQKCRVEGTVSRECPIGPIRLPTTLQADFVEEFNTTYASVGLRLTAKIDQPRVSGGDDSSSDFARER